MKRSTPRPSSTRGLLRERREALVLGVADVAERPDRAADVDVAARHLARVARELHAGGVDLLELLLEEVGGELAAVGAERVRLDQLGAGADEPEMEVDDALAARGGSPPRGSAGAARRSRRARPCRRRRRSAARCEAVPGSDEAITFTLKVWGRDADRARRTPLRAGGLTAKFPAAQWSRTAGLGPPSAWSGSSADSSLKPVLHKTAVRLYDPPPKGEPDGEAAGSLRFGR